MQVAKAGIIWAKVDGIYIYSVYAPPTVSIGEFETLMDQLVEDARERTPLIIAVASTLRLSIVEAR